MEPKSPENPMQNRDIPSEIVSGETTTHAVKKEDLQVYVDAALRTRFGVEQIAESGEEFPVVKRPAFTKPNFLEPRSVSMARVPEGQVAIAISRPRDEVSVSFRKSPHKDYDPFEPFWDEAMWGLGTKNLMLKKKV